MARLFPFRSEPSQTEERPRVVGLAGEDADAVFSALSSTTARRIYARLDEEPGTPSDVADAIDSSIQNVRYHLENLEEAGLVEVVDTWYSSRGNEMSVYATTDGPLIVTSDESTASKLREALSRFVGGITALAAGSLLLQYGLTRWAESAMDRSESATAPDGGGGDDAAYSAEDEGDDVSTESAEDVTTTTEEADTAADGANGTEDAANEPGTFDAEPTGVEANDSADQMTDAGVDAAAEVFATIPPGLLFFLGGLVVLVAITVYWYWYRPTY